MATSEARRRRRFGMRACAWRKCGAAYLPHRTEQRYCGQTCAMKARWAGDGGWRMVEAAKVGGARSAARRRRLALDALARQLGGPVTERDLLVWRRAWAMALGTVRWREQAAERRFREGSGNAGESRRAAAG
jgi:hypothetical protein